jgi:chromosome segregation ATPase
MSEPRTFTEDEHLAVLADRVAKETASLSESVTTLSAEKADLAAKLDVAEAARVSLDAEKAAAIKEFADFKASLEAEVAALAKKDERLVAAKAAATHLPEEFFTDEARVARIVAMSDESFEAYAADLAATNSAPVVKEGAPRETAMNGSAVTAPVADTTPTRSAAYDLLLPTLSLEGGK